METCYVILHAGWARCPTESKTGAVLEVIPVLAKPPVCETAPVSVSRVALPLADADPPAVKHRDGRSQFVNGAWEVVFNPV